jgi:nucleotide-binding universal stress UspA family protein
MIVGERIPAHLPRILVPATEDPALIRFAAKFAKAHRSALLSVYVQQHCSGNYAHLSPRSREAMSLASDLPAQAAFETMRKVCAQERVPVLQIYSLHDQAGDVLLDHAATWGVEAMIMGASRKQRPLPVPAEPLLAQVYDELPPSIPLLIHT